MTIIGTMKINILIPMATKIQSKNINKNIITIAFDNSPIIYLLLSDQRPLKYQYLQFHLHRCS